MPKDQRLQLLTILDSITKIEKYIASISNAQEFYNDDKTFDAVIMNIIIIGESVSKLEESFKEQHPQIDWFKIKAIRNIAAHDYLGINAEMIWQILQNHISPLKQTIESAI